MKTQREAMDLHLLSTHMNSLSVLHRESRMEIFIFIFATLRHLEVVALSLMFVNELM